MKLSLSRVTLLLQFLAALVADDEDASSHPLDSTLPAAMTNAPSDEIIGGAASGANSNAIANARLSDTSENDVDNDASARIRTQAQHVEISNSTPDNTRGTVGTGVETATEVLHDDSLTSMPSVIPSEITKMGRVQNDHTEVVVSVDAVDEHIEAIGTRTRTDASREQIENTLVGVPQDGHERKAEREDTIHEPPQAEIERSVEAIPETSETEGGKTLDVNQIETKTDRDTEDGTRIDSLGEHVEPIQQDDDNDNYNDHEDDYDNEVVVDYADKSTGAIILDKSPNFKGTNNLLLGNNDRYAISPCEGDGVKYVIIGLSEDIEVNTIKLSSYERYSSLAKKFEVLGSTTYPISSKWEKLGTFEAKPWFKENGEQTFQLEHPSWCRYLKFRFISHYGVEHYCTVTEVKVHGSTTQQGFHMQWDNNDAEEDVEEQDEVVVQQVQLEPISSGKEMSGERKKIEIIDGMGSAESTPPNEKVIDDRNNDPDTYGTGNDSEINVSSKEPSDELAAREGRAGMSNDSANDIPKRENVNKDEALVMGDEPRSIKSDPSTDGTTSVEKKPTQMAKLNQTIRSEILDRMDTSGTDDAAPRPASMRSNTGKTELNTSSATRRESGNRQNTSTGRLTLRRGLINSRLLARASSEDPFTSELRTKFSAILSASVKTASSKFVTEKARADATNASILDSQVSLHHVSPTAPRSVKNIQNLIKAKVSSGREIAKGRSHINDPVPQGASTVSKVVKDALDTMNIMNMKGAPSLSGLLEILNKNFLEAFQDSKTTGNSRTNVKEVLEKVILTDADDRPAVQDTNSPRPSSFSTDTVIETKSESPVSRHDLLKSISDQACLEDLDFQVFKAKLSKTGGAGSISGNGAAGGNKNAKNEPIFKKLTDEIKVLQTSQSIHDQYVKAMTTCYEKVIVDFYKEVSSLKTEQEERLLSMEEQIRLLGQKQDDGSLMDNVMVYLKFSYMFMYEYLELAYQWSYPFLSRMNGLLVSLKMRVVENETVQEFCRLTNYHSGEICAFFAGSMFCFLIVSLVWWYRNRKVAVVNSNPIQVKGTVDVEELQEKGNVAEEGSGKRKRKKVRRPRKQSTSNSRHMVVTDYSESSLGSINRNSSFG